MEAAVESDSSDGQSVAADDSLDKRVSVWSLPVGFQQDGISEDSEGLDTELLVGASELLAT